jgi:hypothetical protein
MILVDYSGDDAFSADRWQVGHVPGWHDHVAVDDLGHVGGFVADSVADALKRDAVAAHDRDRGVAAFVGVPVPDARSQGHLPEAPVEGVTGVHAAVLVAEDEIVVLPGDSCG